MMYHLLLLFQLQLLLWPALSSSSEETPPIAKLGCLDHCGSVRIPYPFGIGSNCYHDQSYEIACNTSFDPPKPFLQQYNLQVLDINWAGKYNRQDPRWNEEGYDQILTVGIPATSICKSDRADKVTDMTLLAHIVDLQNSPYYYSSSRNTFMVKGCGGSVMLKDRKGEILTGCASVCANDAANNISRVSCHGTGCCQAEFLSDFDFYQIELDRGRVEPNSYTCNMVAALIETSFVDKFAGSLTINMSTFPTVLNWGGRNFKQYGRNVNIYNCFEDERGTRQCRCNIPYEEGNAFLPEGCKIARECRKCKHHCQEYSTDHRYYCVNPLLKPSSILGFSISVGSVLLFLGCYGLYRVVKRKREVKRKAKYFKRNGGFLLQQPAVSCSEGASGKTKIFRITELERATDKFNKNRILGQGGQGTVYKGMLIDGKIVAIKKAKQVDESQLEQFINEVVILSQINHRNVVKLLGCCLETEVPLLVYEFIPNGTLYQHIQDPSEEFHVTWKMRLQIAAETADALAYLHSSSSTPIYHRDIKSSNILLDGKYRAKVSDFGTSRAIDIEQTHVTTCVLGTYGYLDPEYFQSNQFTEKSDVYSFGVVLVELITGKKPIRPTHAGGWISLASEFPFHMETSRVFDILDKRVLEEGKEEEFIGVADLAKQCLSMNGKERPTMEEIAELLDMIRSSNVCDPKESHGKNKHAVTDKSDGHSVAFSRNTFHSDINLRTRCSSKVQLPIANTL